MSRRTRFDASSRYVLNQGGQTSSRIGKSVTPFRIHVVTQGDTIDNLSYRILGDHSRWWEIADLNPQLVTSGVLTLTPGEPIRVPT
jgi:nucleoid-associated protein YgaU